MPHECQKFSLQIRRFADEGCMELQFLKLLISSRPGRKEWQEFTSCAWS